MCEFTHHGTSEAFGKAVRSALAELPTIGDPNPTKVLALAHYSKDREIQTFNRSIRHHWTDRVSEDYAIVGKLIGLTGVVFRALYIIRVGIGDSYTPRSHRCEFMSEWAIDMGVNNDQFAKLELNYDKQSGVYVPI